MTYTPSINGLISSENSSTTPLGLNATFTGTGVNVTQYTGVEVNIVTNVNSKPTGVSIEFSTDNINWDIKQQFTYLVNDTIFFYKNLQIQAKFCRIVYTTSTAQSLFRLQTKFHTNFQNNNIKLDESLVDAFGRLRVSNPLTILELTHINGKQPNDEIEVITGSATSVSDTNASMITCSTTGTGAVSLYTRRRGFYQPGKSLLWLITGVLNGNTNDSTVTTRIGCFDNDNGYFFKYNNNIISIVERSRSTGSVIETAIEQKDWNVRKLNGTDGIALDPSKTLIYWASIEWLGVGAVNVGISIGGVFYTLHRFRHANLLTTPYMTSVSLPIRWDISSTGGSGSMKCICGSIISEGGFQKLGNVFSANMGRTTKSINNTTPIISLRINSSFPKINIKLIANSFMSTSNADALIQFWIFTDTVATSILTGSSFVSGNTNSKAEYDVSSTAINTTGGRLLYSSYFSSSIDSISNINTDDLYITFNNGISDLLVITGETIGAADNIVASITWDELY